jgi:GNAT superfamily N-acetyltransferase
MNAQPLRMPDIDPVTIRPIEPGDLPRMLALCVEHARSVAHERLPYGTAKADTFELTEALFDTPRRAWAWVAESGDELVGYISATVDFSILERGYYVNLDYPFVRPAWQRIGVESRLFQSVVALAKDTGCLYIQLQAPNWKVDVTRLHGSSSARRVEMVRYVLPVATDCC